MLEIEGVSIRFGDNPEAVSDTTFTVGDGDRLAVVGETGSGKSVLLLAALGLLPASARVTGSIRLNGRELLGCREREFNRIRGKEIAYIPQGSGNGLNPLYTVGHQLCEAIRKHQPCTRKEALVQAAALLESFGLEHGAALCRSYPFQLSGGMRQRAMIAIALACSPKLLIADEPTTALDVTIQAQILNLIKRLNRELDMTTILITHDLGVVATLCDKVVVMYGGLIMEDGTVEEIFYHPKHPYTMGLIDSIPRVTGGEKQRLKPIPGTPPNLIHPPKGCPFSTRCPYCMNVCMEEMPPYFQEDGHRTMCWLLHEEAPVNPEYVQRKEAMRRADG